MSKTVVTNEVICPEVEPIAMIGEDGNAFACMGRVIKAMRKANVSTEIKDAFRAECMDGDYDHLLATCFKYVRVWSE
jgi:hypothetical protein